jgi:hypothetical protein
VVWCPTQFQRYVPGREYRVHVVGQTIFACEVISDADDYRHPRQGDGKVELRKATIPLDVVRRCRRVARDAGLHVAGLDLRHGTDGEWYCLEANPSPAFTYYEQATGQPIAAAIARLLAGPPTRGTERRAPGNGVDHGSPLDHRAGLGRAGRHLQAYENEGSG